MRRRARPTTERCNFLRRHASGPFHAFGSPERCGEIRGRRPSRSRHSRSNLPASQKSTFALSGDASRFARTDSQRFAAWSMEGRQPRARAARARDDRRRGRKNRRRAFGDADETPNMKRYINGMQPSWRPLRVRPEGATSSFRGIDMSKIETKRGIDRRSLLDRRSGVGIRSEEESQSQGERRRGDRRSEMDRHGPKSKKKIVGAAALFIIICAIVTTGGFSYAIDTGLDTIRYEVANVIGSIIHYIERLYS
jgi:hypothetical protein